MNSKKSYFIIRENCPACNSKNSKELYSSKFNELPISKYLEDFYNHQGGVEFKYLEDESYILDECVGCGLVYQRAIPNDFLMTKLYEEWIDPKKVLNQNVKNRSLRYYSKFAREIEMIINYFKRPSSELKFFDFGSGWGHWCRLAKAYGCSVLGTELSQTRIDYSNKIGISMIEWDEIPNYQFDFINTEQVFEHIANPLETLEHLIKSLKPSGIIKISVPNGNNIKLLLTDPNWEITKGTKSALNIVAPLEHINCFSQHAIEKMMHIISFEPVEIKKQSSNQKPSKLWDYSLRDFLKPIYNKIVSKPKVRNNSTTYLFFKRSSKSLF